LDESPFSFFVSGELATANFSEKFILTNAEKYETMKGRTLEIGGEKSLWKMNFVLDK
jgi:hypothetical protein